MKPLVRNHKCVVATLLALLIVFGAIDIAHAQQLLVSNMQQRSFFFFFDKDPRLSSHFLDADPPIYPWVPLTAWTPVTQEFETGKHENGYEIDTIKFDVRPGPNPEEPNLSVSIWSEEVSFDHPSTLLYTLVSSEIIPSFVPEGTVATLKDTLLYTFIYIRWFARK